MKHSRLGIKKGWGFTLMASLVLTALQGVSLPTLAEASVSYRGCSSAQRNLIDGALTKMRSRMSALKRSIDRQTGYSMGDVWTSQWSNADIHCDDRSLICRGDIAAFAVPGTNNVTICNESSDDYINQILRALSDTDDREACVAGLLAHEFTHNGFGFEGKADQVGLASIQFWLDEIGGNRNIRSPESCGFVVE